MLKDFAIDAEGLGFNSQAGQIGHSVANGSPPMRRFFGANAQALTRGVGAPPLAATLRLYIKLNETSMMKI